jgi:hypothetical protein
VVQKIGGRLGGALTERGYVQWATGQYGLQVQQQGKGVLESTARDTRALRAGQHRDHHLGTPRQHGVHRVGEGHEVVVGLHRGQCLDAAAGRGDRDDEGVRTGRVGVRSGGVLGHRVHTRAAQPARHHPGGVARAAHANEQHPPRPPGPQPCGQRGPRVGLAQGPGQPA